MKGAILNCNTPDPQKLQTLQDFVSVGFILYHWYGKITGIRIIGRHHSGSVFSEEWFGLKSMENTEIDGIWAKNTVLGVSPPQAPKNGVL